MNIQRSTRRRQETKRRNVLKPKRRGSAANTAIGSRTSSKTTQCNGVLELHPKGYGFLRRVSLNLARRDDDVFVSESIVQDFQLRAGSSINGMSQFTRGNTGPRLVRLNDINGVEPESYADVPSFEELTPTNPQKWLRMERKNEPDPIRVLDLFCPFGIGQRALVASPPRTGKTTLLKEIGRSITVNQPDLHLSALLIDERPEEVTDMQAEIDGEVFASSLDEDAANHARLARLVLSRCQRIAETGKDVVLLVDSLTRLSRACNKLPNMTGAIGAGGLNIHALDLPKQLFAAARSFKEGGSLTIVATVLIETENRMDEIIFREFKGTGNLDIVLSQPLADHRIYPAIDIGQSATRRVELLQDPETLNATTALRTSLLHLPTTEAMKELNSRLKQYESNADFLSMISQSIKSG